MNPFVFLESINTTKQHLMDADPLCERSYNAFLVNRGLSYFADTVFFANAMNTSQADNRLQYDYLYHSIRKKTRRSKWHKPESDERLLAICQLYGYSVRQAKQALKILNSEQLQAIVDEYRHREGK
jgi:hypothetical protein